jgi:tetratricopeptide (TPR) repeat protein
MTTTTYAADRAALRIVDPYNDFMSEGGEFYEAIRKTVEAVGDGRTWLRQLHHFVTRAALTLWGPACRGAGRGGQWTALAVGMAVALAASPVQAAPAMPAVGFGMPTPVSPVNEAIVAADLEAAERLSDLGDRYVGQHALADAEAAFRGALAIFEAALGPADPRVADSMTALADVRAERRDFTGAESLYQRALAVTEMAYGPDDARLASPLADLAGLYLTWERWDQAIPLYLRLANLFERLLGADDFHLAMTLDHVAEAYAGQAHYAEAEEFYGRVLAILTPRLGSDNPVVQRVLTEHARARRQLELSGAKKS